MSRYNLHWQGQEGYARAQARKESGLNAITKDWSDDWKNEIGIMSQEPDNGAPYERTGDFYMEPHSQFGVTTYGKKTRDEFGNVSYEPISTSYLANGDDMNSSVDFEDHKIKNRLSRPEDNLEAVYFGVYANGDIDAVPQSLGKLLHTISSSKKSYEGDDAEKASAFNAYYDFLNQDNYLQKSFSLTNVAYICVSAKDVSTGVKSSKYWVNPKPLFLLSKTVNKEKVKFVREVNNEELEQALEVFAKKEANNLEMY